MVVATERCTECLALSTGCKARRALLTALGVTARFTTLPVHGTTHAPRNEQPGEEAHDDHPQTGSPAQPTLRQLMVPLKNRPGSRTSAIAGRHVRASADRRAAHTGAGPARPRDPPHGRTSPHAPGNAAVDG